MHQMNRVYSRSDYGHEDSIINIVVDYYSLLLLWINKYHLLTEGTFRNWPSIVYLCPHFSWRQTTVPTG